jgi:phage baseplate assembly protein W
MSTPRYRAWKFSDLGSTEVGKATGPCVSNRGGIDMVEGDSSVRQAILLLLATRPGERVMRPHYGCNLQRLVFSPNDDTTAGLAIHYVRQAIERWEPRVEVVHLDASRPEGGGSPGALEIYLEYRVRATLQAERLAYAFDLTGERT